MPCCFSLVFCPVTQSYGNRDLTAFGTENDKRGLSMLTGCKLWFRVSFEQYVLPNGRFSVAGGSQPSYRRVLEFEPE